MSNKKTGVRVDRHYYVGIDFDPVAPSVQTKIIRNGQEIPQAEYVTVDELQTILADYITSSDLNTELDDYVSDSDLSTALSSYVTGSDLTTTLGDYVTDSDLTTTLGDYVTETMLNDHLVMDQHESETISVSANSTATPTLTFTKSGYYPLGVVGFYSNWVSGQTAQLNFYAMHVSEQATGSVKINVAVRNNYTSTTEFKFRAYVLWAKI